MRVLFTGGSSFTGCWFVRALASVGHQVMAVMTRESLAAYGTDARRERVEAVARDAEVVYGCRFGDERFLSLAAERPGWDVLCHHGAQVAGYRDPGFDVVDALASNTHHVREVLSRLREGGCSRVVLTGSVFEGGEGAGSDGLPHFSPYGLSKALTSSMFAYFARAAGMRLGKFVISNPFGPLEAPRFTDYLARTWLAGETPGVQTPHYVRDNIHVSLLAMAYADFVSRLPAEPGFSKVNPSGYVESQGAFAQRFARELGGRLGVPCPLEPAASHEFTEPRIRINTDPPDAAALGWDEPRAWDKLAEYYRLNPPQASEPVFSEKPFALTLEEHDFYLGEARRHGFVIRRPDDRYAMQRSGP